MFSRSKITKINMRIAVGDGWRATAPNIGKFGQTCIQASGVATEFQQNLNFEQNFNFAKSGTSEVINSLRGIWKLNP